ncbi:MAG: aminopeptidase P family protein [Rhodospirillales bacterium]
MRTASEGPPYQGDAALAALLREAGSPLQVAAVRSHVEGLAAAPERPGDDDWTRRVVPGAAGVLRSELIALARAARAATERALAPRPAPAARLDALRARMTADGLDGFVVPMADEHQNEFVPLRAQRIRWLTGFAGSAGLVVVLRDCAAIFVDGRYTLQVRHQVDTGRFEPHHVTESPPAAWIARHLPAGGRLGYDAWLHTVEQVLRFEEACRNAGGTLAAVDANPLDAVWTDQPPAPLAPMVPHDLAFAGRASADKRAEIAQGLKERKAAAVVLSAPESIAWLLNVRGGDVASTPLALAYAIVRADASVALFMDPRKVAPDLRAHLGEGVEIRGPDSFGPALDALAQAGGAVQVDPATSPAWIAQRLRAAKAEVANHADPCVAPRACKNAVEIAGSRAAHVRDGAALCTFLAWLDRTARSGTLSEVAVADRLYEFRAAGERFRGTSFDTIAGAGPNGAIVHYRADADTDRRIEPGSVLLVDSGAQYLDGTTDVTRTVWIDGAAPDGVQAEARDRFTRVLKGHIAIATARFPAGTTGHQLDPLARMALWAAGLDYDHGTGHGVGSYLGVHEGPQRIGKQGSAVALKPGMIVSNEPGYYKEGAYGIRIENLEVVTALPRPDGGERDVLGFTALTLAPIDRRLIDPALLNETERAWLDTYHARVRERVGPLVDAETSAWLDRMCAPIGA